MAACYLRSSFEELLEIDLEYQFIIKVYRALLLKCIIQGHISIYNERCISVKHTF